MFTGHNSPVACGGFTPDGKLVVCGGGGDSDASLKIFDPKNGVCLHSIEGHGFHESGTAPNKLQRYLCNKIVEASRGTLCV